MRALYCLFTYLILLPSVLIAQDEIGRKIETQRLLLIKDAHNKRTLKDLSMLYLQKPDFDSAIYYGKILQDIAYDMPQDNFYMMYSHIILGQAYAMKGEGWEAFNNLGQAKASAEVQKNDTALCSIYNGLGLYDLNINRDYYSSISNFYQGLERAKRCKNERLYSILLSNIASVYYLKKDTVGLQYAQECYELGHKNKDTYLIRIGSETSAFMLYLKHDYATALNYIKEAEFTIIQNNFYDQADIYSLYGMILSALNYDQQAIEMYKKAFQYASTSQATSVLNNYIQYARTLIKLKQNNEAIQQLQEGEDFSNKNNIMIHKGELYENIASLYEQMGMLDKALVYNKKSQTEKDSLFNTSKEYFISDLRIKYYSEKLENEIKETRIEKLKKEQKIEKMTAYIVIILLICGFIFYLYQRQRKLYRAIVQQNLQSIQREKNLLEQITLLKTHDNEPTNTTSDKYTGSSLSNEKGTDLFNRLETLMREQRIYTDNLITKEKVSEMLGTNRTYLSQTINEQTGKTFTQYINEYRTHEAIKRLSSPNDSIPLKALSAELGFNSMTTFYNLFQSTTGMTPAQYRNSVHDLEKS